MSNISRRRFLSGSLSSVGAMAVGGATVTTAQSQSNKASGQNNVLGANERIRVGLIGCGGMGRGDLRTFFRNQEVQCPVVCDVDDAMIANAVKTVKQHRGTTPETVKDFRRIMDRKDVDVCLVATPDHWHALPTIHACQAGKDVYVEKPLATSIGEGRVMLQAARKYDRVVQMGTQWRSGPHYQEAVDYVQSGKLGKIRLVRCWAYLNWINSVGKPEDAPVPEGVDYDMWLGPAPRRPFNPARFHFTFRWFWDYGGGLMTDWGVHLINIALWAMQEKGPNRVSSSGGKYVYDDISDTPDTQHTLYDFPEFTMVWEHQMTASHGCEGREHGVAFHGSEATLVVDSKGWEVIPEQFPKNIKKIDASLVAEKHKKKGDGRPQHIRNFLDCVRSRQRPVEDVEIGHRISAVAHLGNLALRSGRIILWDAEAERVVGQKDLDEMITRPYRRPWELKA